LEDGYAVFPGLVSRSNMEPAKQKIEQDLRTNYDVNRQAEYDHRSYCPDIRRAPEIAKLSSSPAVSSVVDNALGLKRISWSPAQIAIRKAHNSAIEVPPHPHIDGVPTVENGVAGAKIQSFTALLGIFLTTVKQDFAGNFTVWPGSHLLLQSHFQREGSVALSQGMPQIPLGLPLQLHSAPGDVILCHYQLGHAAAVNLSDDDRIALFFRLTLHEIDSAIDANAESNQWSHLTNIWRGWKFE
jgi:ectoine hydroxylase-related dioxygenase (phytanoyl-CoA dioxygenase family)